MATRAVSGVVKKSDGSPWYGGEVRFQLVHETYRLSPSESYPVSPIRDRPLG